MSAQARATALVRDILGRRQAWVLAGAFVTLLGAWLVIMGPEEAPELGNVALGPLLYYLQWVIYAAIIVLLGIRIVQYRRARSPREDIGFVFLVVLLYTAGFMLHYTPFVYHFPEGPVTGVIRAIVMFGCGILGAMYGLSSTHRWH